MAAKPIDGGRNAQLRRALNMLRELNRSTGLSIAQMAERYGTDERTIRRDLEAFQEEGLPLTAETGENNRKLWRLQATDHARQLSKMVDSSHYMALRLAMDQGGPVRNDLAIFGALEDLHEKIEKVIGQRGRAQLRALDQAFLSYEKQAYRQTAPDVMWLLVAAITERRLCRVAYRAALHAGREKSFVVLPLRIFVHTGAAHLLCHVPKHNTYIPLNLQRLSKLERLDEKAEVPSDFDPDMLEKSAFGVHQGGAPTHYRLRFAAEVALYIRERLWHPSQELVELPKGEIELSFTCGASWEVSAWVSSWRHWVHVLEPSTLQAELHALGETLQQRYSRSPRASSKKPLKKSKNRRPAS
jgi:predicted DNA-binding transcriptional regulator YafY